MSANGYNPKHAKCSRNTGVRECPDAMVLSEKTWLNGHCLTTSCPNFVDKCQVHKRKK